MEGTAGNTGIGLAHLCNSLGYKCVIFMPNTQSQVSQNMLLIEEKHGSISTEPEYAEPGLLLVSGVGFALGQSCFA